MELACAELLPVDIMLLTARADDIWRLCQLEHLWKKLGMAPELKISLLKADWIYSHTDFITVQGTNKTQNWV